MKIIRKILPGLIIIAITVVVIVINFSLKPEPENKPVEIVARTIRTVVAKASDIQLAVETQGTVMAKQVIDIVPQVAGEIVYVSDKFVAGGRFEKGEVIIKIEPRDFELAVTISEARIAESNQRLIQEEAEAELAISEWEQLGEGEASDLTLRKPQREGALAAVKSAQASLLKSKLDLERTIIRAPYAGLLTQKDVDLGQFLNRGARVGKYYSTEVLELRLPLTNRDLSQFDWNGLRSGSRHYKVLLTGTFANKQSTWNARLVRSEGVIDVKSRILYVVAELRGDELYSNEDRTPITIGQFVTAEIEGRALKNIYVLPRESLRQGNQILIVDQNNKLRTKMVDVMEANEKYIVVSSGVKIGDVVNVSQLGIAVDGQLVQFSDQNTNLAANSNTDGIKTITQENNDD